jgi:D-lactate dehydrogenase
MRIILFSSKPYDQQSFSAVEVPDDWRLSFQEAHLREDSAGLAAGYQVVCAFINDDLSAPVLRQLAAGGTRLIALRSAGYNHVDLHAAQALGLTVVRVPAYSPHAVAEHALALIMTLNRRTHRAFNRTREGDFTLRGLIGFDLHGKTVGIIGAGQIGLTFARIMVGLGCQILFYDPTPISDLASLGAQQVPLDELLERSHIISLHCPLNSATHHLINAARLRQMRRGVMLINTGRGALIDTPALIGALKSGQLGYLGLDVYEEEAELFFEDHSEQPLQDDVLARLLNFPNVLITAHQGFLTHEALAAIASTTRDNIVAWQADAPINQLLPAA